ncbi:hypothetical protein COO91_10090 (plasmid) [Nostoc flagelliforme CCNUN1]|uniref:Uncharacterized protein n=1 Tax=Nostoc flagelliforme CCNUN1 TaxID=2038116 RepID=A0A2K8T9Z3_9NOSO|nr:hypothetical protein [Nostoc flagelliforme]AUB43885.1 hypothetical protein COO91_10090 [Nostoc flagelliforme CCNUN1]
MRIGISWALGCDRLKENFRRAVIAQPKPSQTNLVRKLTLAQLKILGLGNWLRHWSFVKGKRSLEKHY